MEIMEIMEIPRNMSIIWKSQKVCHGLLMGKSSVRIFHCHDCRRGRLWMIWATGVSEKVIIRKPQMVIVIFFKEGMINYWISGYTTFFRTQLGAQNWAYNIATGNMCHVWDELTLPVLGQMTQKWVVDDLFQQILTLPACFLMESFSSRLVR